ncbi:hypothetical protein GWP85_10995 [Acinetobacter beijerinckii]|uniref:hypothetical protein n=1 Tax=Acinetobacter beijerinckii TaxID=262668 RepID=UPI0023DDFE1C|nr:hypothetical protein [Acinetobacter beijerinckii]MDF2418029.1 hypothetical protein [Acinetobacter beijerinckii]
MSDILSRVQILLDADTARFEQGMRDAEESSGSSFKKIRESANTMGAWVVSAGLAATGALLSMAEAQAEQAQQIEIAAYKAQASTTEIQKYGFAAKQVGIETDALADIYKDFNEKMGEMVTVGGGGALDFFEQVALKTEGSAEGAMKLAKEIASLSGPEAMGLYVKKMEEANLSQDQMSFLMESAASEATMLLPLYRNNGEQIKLWGDALERTGAILDEAGIKKAAEFRVQSELLKMQMEGMETQLVQAVVPAFVDIADAFSTGDQKARAMADGGEVLANTLRGVAAVGIGVYTTVNLIANSLAGLTATSVAAIGVANREAEAANAKWYDKLPGVKLFKASVMVAADVKSPTGIVADMADQNARIVEEGAGMLNKIFDKTVSDATAKMASAYDSVNQAQSKTTQGQQDWLDTQNKVAEAASKANQKQKEQENLLKQLQQERWSIEYENADRLSRMEKDLYKDVERVKKAGFRPDSEQSIIKMLDQRASLEKAIWIDQYEFDLNEFKLTEESKLQWKQRINEMSIELDRELTRSQKDTKRQATLDQYNYELDLLKNRKQQELLEIQRYQVTELEFIRKNEALKRQEIEKTLGISDEERKARLGLLDFDTQSQVNNMKDLALDDLRGMHNDLNATDGYQALQDQFDTRMKILDDNLAAENITWDHYLSSRADLLQKYNDAEFQMNLGHVQSISGSMLDVLEDTAGKQSGIYRTMFAVNKAFAIAQSLISITQGIAMAAANPFPYNLAAMATVAASTVGLVANIQSVEGVFHGGADYVPKESSYLLDKGERVLSPRQNADLTRYLDDQKQGNGNGTNVIINVPSGYIANESRDANGNVTIDVVRQEIASSWNNLSRSNSHESRSVQQSFGLAPVR